MNNDGYQDLFVSSYDPTKLGSLGKELSEELRNRARAAHTPKLFINNKNGGFNDESKDYNIEKTMFAMGSNFGDLDNDGYLDFYIGNGSPNYGDIIPNRVFRNVEGKNFEEVTSAGRFGHLQKGHAVSFADLDRDGDQEIYAVMGGAYDGDVFTNVLYENPMSKNNWVVFELIGVTTNKSAIGTVLKLELDDQRTIYHTIGTGGSFGSNSLQAEIGIGSSNQIDKLTIYWQNGKEEVFLNVAVNEKFQITEGELSLKKTDYFYKAFKKSKNHHH